MPLPSASRTSITTTSGRVRWASSIASCTVPACAVTTTSSWASSIALMPSRTISWSSTSMTLSGGVLLIGADTSGATAMAASGVERQRVAPPRSRKSLSVASATRNSTARSSARPNSPERRHVSGAHRELQRRGPSGAISRSASSSGNRPAASDRDPPQRHDGLRRGASPAPRARCATRRAHAHLLAEPDLGEQGIAIVGSPRSRARGAMTADPRSSAASTPVGVHGDLHEVASEHATKCRSLAEVGDGPRVLVAEGQPASAVRAAVARHGAGGVLALVKRAIGGSGHGGSFLDPRRSRS